MYAVIITNKYTGRSYLYPVIYTDEEKANTAIKQDIPQGKCKKDERPKNILTSVKLTACNLLMPHY